jgi:hypothetical protein
LGPVGRIAPHRHAVAIAACALCAFALVCAFALGLASRAAAGTVDAVLKDFESDNDITACLFTKRQLKKVKSQLGADINVYSPEFKAELNREIRRWTNGGCSGGKKALRIAKAKGTGGVRKEFVTLENAGRNRLRLNGYALRDRAHKKLRLGGVTLAGGRTLRVITGCAAGKHAPSARGSRFYACEKKQHWNDRGDVAELLSPGGTVIGRLRTF